MWQEKIFSSCAATAAAQARCPRSLPSLQRHGHQSVHGQPLRHHGQAARKGRQSRADHGAPSRMVLQPDRQRLLCTRDRPLVWTPVLQMPRELDSIEVHHRVAALPHLPGTIPQRVPSQCLPGQPRAAAIGDHAVAIQRAPASSFGKKLFTASCACLHCLF